MADLNDIDYAEESILVVDDEEAVREPLVEMLGHIGLEAYPVGGGQEALRAVREKPYTFLLTDMKMPEMDGLELIGRVSKMLPEICIIAMTGYSKGYRYLDVINADFINKPFGIEELEAKVRRAINERNIKRELSRLSITDALTGLFNQRHFYTRLKEEITRAERQKHTIALILLDLDDFKYYNDSYGHLAGDELLQKVGGIINAVIREGVDSGYRYGGDEFAVILIDADIAIAKGIAERIESAIERDCRATASLGYAHFREGMTLEELVAKADEFLYKFKGKKKKLMIENGPLV
jgi:two-component system cell cycle response regulator